MAVIRKLRSGKWQTVIRRKGYPTIYKTFLEKSLASKYARMIESQMERNMFEDMSGAENTTLRSLLIKYRDEIVPTYKSARTLTYKINYILKDKVCYYGLTQLNSNHLNEFKKRISVGRAPKTINGYISTLAIGLYVERSMNINKNISAEKDLTPEEIEAQLAKIIKDAEETLKAQEEEYDANKHNKADD